MKSSSKKEEENIDFNDQCKQLTDVAEQVFKQSTYENQDIDKIKLIDRDKVKTGRIYNKMDSFSSYSSTEIFSEITQDHDINEAALFVEIKNTTKKEYLENVNSSDLYFIDNTYSISLKNYTSSNSELSFDKSKENCRYEGKGSTDSWRNHRVRYKQNRKENASQAKNGKRNYPFPVKNFTDDFFK